MHIRKGPTTKKQRISPLLLSGLYPPPGTLPNPNLLQRGLGSGAGGDRRGGVAHYAIRDCAEGAHARSVLSHRVCLNREAGGRDGATRGRRAERIAALGVGR